MDTTRVVIADDHALLREGMRKLLEQEPDLTVVGEAADGAEAVRAVASLAPDVVLMDVVMPGLSGIEAAREIKKSNPKTAVLILSAYDDERYVIGLLEAGVAGYLLKSATGQEVVQAIRAIRAGDAVLHPTVTARLLARVSHQSGHDRRQPIGNGLTERELEVLRLAARGLSNKEIAAHMALTLPTVKAHLVNLFNKISVGSRTEAVLHALREGWIQLDDLADESHADPSGPPPASPADRGGGRRWPPL